MVADLFEQYRPLLFSIAYRMLGSVMDADDMVQETFLRWQQARDTEVQAPKAYLSAVVTRLCIDRLRSARARREEYLGPWLPEPLGTADLPDLAATATLAESLSMAFLVLLESLTPLERAVFLLHDVFDYDYAEIATFVEKSEANCRQIARRARQHVTARRPRFDPSPEEQERLTGGFVRACASGDLPALLALLADDITLWSDGGGKVQAARKPIHGADAVARFIVGILGKATGTIIPRSTRINGQPGILTYLDGHLINALTLDIVAGRIAAIRIVANPEKLHEEWLVTSEE